MRILRHNELHPGALTPQFERTVALLEQGDFRGAEVKKLAQGTYYRAKLSAADRLIFRFGTCRGETYLILLEIVRNHAYAASRFLRGATVDEAKLEPLTHAPPQPPPEAVALNYVNPTLPRIHILDKILSFDADQDAALHQPPPLILIGSAGSGKTVLTLEKLRQLPGEILYVTHSPHLVDNARALYYATHYENDTQEVAFLSLLEFVQSLGAPAGRPLAFPEFAAWFRGERGRLPTTDAHAVYEEFNGVLTGSAVTQPYLSCEAYQALGVRRSIFTGEQRPAVYELFRRYLTWLQAEGRYDLNLVCYERHAQCRPTYDFVVADEVQDLTAVQLSLILKALRVPDQFVLCGDSNQIVHPNFFSWASVKSYFYEQRAQGRREIIRILNTNYRNAPRVTELANRLLLIKHARFGSIDRESHYLIKPVSEHPGAVEFLPDTPAVRRDIDAKTGRSTRFAVLVMRDEDKADARATFRTPLVFSVQEAKGLEYENIILLNFISSNTRVYQELVNGVRPEDLEGDFTYGRAKERGDKSLEAYKFFVNALYVAATRAVQNLYLVERVSGHPLLMLLQVRQAADAGAIAAQQSSDAEWQAEARRLERQGKTEQVEAIRRTILQTQPVPWEVLTPERVDAVTAAALAPGNDDVKTRRLLLDYAATYAMTPLMRALAAAGFRPALRVDEARHTALQRHTADYHQRGYRDLFRKVALHGVDFRNQLNQTPLMLAAQLGLVPVVQRLVAEGAHRELRDNWGRIPLQIALRAAYSDPHYARGILGQIYGHLAPDALKVVIGGRLLKLDSHRMEFFLLHSMLARFEFLLRTKIRHRIPAFETADFVDALAHFPESVIPARRRARPAISAVLARNEVFREGPYNRQVFVRLRRGFYFPNPAMEIETEQTRRPIWDILHLDRLAAEQGDDYLADFLAAVRVCRGDVDAHLRVQYGAEARVAAQAPRVAPRPVEESPQPDVAPVEALPAAATPPVAVPLTVVAPPAPARPELQAALQALRNPGQNFPTEAVRWLQAHWEESAPHLLHTLESVIRDPAEVNRRNGFEHLFALFLLAQFRERRAYPLVLRFAALPEVEDLMGDGVTEDLGRILASVAPRDLHPIQRLIENPTANEWVRSAGVRALLTLCLHGTLERAQVVAYLHQLLTPRDGLRREPSYVWNMLAEAAERLHPGALLNVLERGYRDGLIDSGVMAFEELVRQARKPEEAVLAESRRQVAGKISDVVKEMSWWACFNEADGKDAGEAPESQVVPVAPPDASAFEPIDLLREPVGERQPTEPYQAPARPSRNAPCPCGSGKKYKKCCGR